MRSRDQWKLWEKLQVAIDNSPEVPPCTNFPDLFFGDAGTTPLADIGQAKKLCSTCPIQLDCAQYAIEADEDYGVWGGLSTLDRKRLKTKYGSYRKASKALELRYKKPRPNGIQADNGQTL